jgi:hypothetical protein
MVADRNSATIYQRIETGHSRCNVPTAASSDDVLLSSLQMRSCRIRSWNIHFNHDHDARRMLESDERENNSTANLMPYVKRNDVASWKDYADFVRAKGLVRGLNCCPNPPC